MCATKVRGGGGVGGGGEGGRFEGVKSWCSCFLVGGWCMENKLVLRLGIASLCFPCP